MRRNKASQTAESAAAFRAAHFLHDSMQIFADPFALKFTNRYWRFIVSKPFFYHWIMEKTLRLIFRPAQAQILSRSRLAELCLSLAVKKGIKQYIMLSAGYDVFPIRENTLADQLNIYEVDHFATQALKIEKLNKLKLMANYNAHFVPVDFERENLFPALYQTSFNSSEPCFISWLGTTPYLTKPAIISTLKTIAEHCAPGSIVVFDYGVKFKYISVDDQAVINRVRTFTTLLGEPMRFELDPDEFIEEVCDLGYQCIENLSTDEIKKRFFSDRDDDLQLIGGSHYVQFRVV